MRTNLTKKQENMQAQIYDETTVMPAHDEMCNKALFLLLSLSESQLVLQYVATRIQLELR